MSKIVYSIILGGLVLAALTVVNIGIVNAGEETKFVQVSVLAQDRANYGVDDHVTVIPVVSADIIENKIYDLQHSVSDTVKTIKYTTLPVKNSGPVNNDDDHTQSVDQPEPKKDHTNKGNTVNNQNQNQTQNQSQNQSSNQNNKDKSTGKDKSTSKGSGTDTGNSSGSDTVKTNNKGGNSASQTK